MIRIGQKLKETRLAKGLSLEDVARATRIKTTFLTAIEKGEYHKLPSSSYALGFVQNYAEFLGLPKRETLALFRRDFDEEKTYKVLPSGFVQDERLDRKRFKIQQAFLIVIVVLILLGGFLIYQYRAAFMSPPLTVISPKENSIISATDVLISGRTDPNATLTINGEPVAVNDDGSFSKTITLFPGKTAIAVRAINTFGKEAQVTRDIDVKDSR
ncbi:MAG TPA: helix-turn-helix domain-containing protein [Patescibacteria group bacterium]|nr:helix-turn-helix domain-containing protein [Patescibacteria group bacterium]